jgi:hypothetical protein
MQLMTGSARESTLHTPQYPADVADSTAGACESLKRKVTAHNQGAHHILYCLRHDPRMLSRGQQRQREVTIEEGSRREGKVKPRSG